MGPKGGRSTVTAVLRKLRYHSHNMYSRYLFVIWAVARRHEAPIGLVQRQGEILRNLPRQQPKLVPKAFRR